MTRGARTRLTPCCLQCTMTQQRKRRGRCSGHLVSPLALPLPLVERVSLAMGPWWNQPDRMKCHDDGYAEDSL